MLKKTLKALKGSIKKWEKIVAGTKENDGPNDCPLCVLFNTDERCNGCPVQEKTGTDHCQKTPYNNYTDHFWGNTYEKHATCPECKKLAQKELDFLKSLLPK